MYIFHQIFAGRKGAWCLRWNSRQVFSDGTAGSSTSTSSYIYTSSFTDILKGGYSTNCAKVPLHCVYAHLNVKKENRLPRLSPTRYYSQDARKCGSRERTSVCTSTRVDLRFKSSKRNCRISRFHNSRFDTSWHFICDLFTRAYTCLRWGPLRNWYCKTFLGDLEH